MPRPATPGGAHSLPLPGVPVRANAPLNSAVVANDTRGAVFQEQRGRVVKRVLLIDDDQRFLQALARELLMQGYRVDEATDGLEGIQKALQDPPDIAVVDLILPRVGGSEVVSFFRQNPYLSSIPIVLLSGVLLESASAVNAIDADCVLTKGPFPDTSRLLLAALDRLAHGAREGKQV